MTPPLVLGRMWEDPALEARVVAHLAAHQQRPLRVGLVASAGCTALSLLALEAIGAIEAFDANPAQLHLVELKRQAIALLPLEDQLTLLGLAPGDEADRARLYERLAAALPPATRLHWDAHPREVACGLAHAGIEDRRFAALSEALAVRGLDPVAHPREALLDARWHEAFEEAFEGPQAAHLAEAYARRLWHELPQENYLLMQPWRAPCDPQRRLAPPYMLPESQRAMGRLGLDRLRLHAGELVSGLEAVGPFEMISLSTLTDAQPSARLHGLFDRLRRALSPGGAILARRVLGGAPLAPILSEHFRLEGALSEELLRQDRAVGTIEVVVAFA